MPMHFDRLFVVKKKKKGVFIEPRHYVKSFGDYSAFTKIGKKKVKC